MYLSPGANAVATADRVRQFWKKPSKTFPPGLDYVIPYDSTMFVRAAIHDVMMTLFEAIGLVILVVFIFLQNWRATLIPLLTVPVAMVGTFALFPLLGFSINMTSMFGLVLAIGIVVDDAIVVVEAVQRHIDEGMTPRAAAIRAMEEVSAPVVAIACILAAVFIPVAFLGGISGQIYKQFALTIAVSVLISAFNALSLSPALSAILLRPKMQTRGPLGRFFSGFNRVFRVDPRPLSHRRGRADPQIGAGAAGAVLLLVRGRLAVPPACPPAFFPTKIRAPSSLPSACPTPRPWTAPMRQPARWKRSSARSRAYRAPLLSAASTSPPAPPARMSPP